MSPKAYYRHKKYNYYTYFLRPHKIQTYYYFQYLAPYVIMNIQDTEICVHNTETS